MVIVAEDMNLTTNGTLTLESHVGNQSLLQNVSDHQVNITALMIERYGCAVEYWPYGVFDKWLLGKQLPCKVLTSH